MALAQAVDWAEPGRPETGDDLLRLVARAQGGDRDAFARIFDLRFDRVSRYARVLVRDATRADDVVSETFLHAWRDLPRLRKLDRFDSWLFRIAHNRAMDELKQRRTVELDAAAHEPDHRRAILPFEVVSARSEAELVRAALLELPDAQREVIVLRYLHELSYLEIATQVGKSHEAVRQLRQRALRRLRRLLLPRLS